MRPAKRPVKADFVLFDVLYEDGSRSSNRRVPANELEGGHDIDKAARAAIEAQDRKLGEASGAPRGRIKSVAKSKTR